jgi:hypothetical protein
MEWHRMSEVVERITAALLRFTERDVGRRQDFNGTIRTGPVAAGSAEEASVGLFGRDRIEHSPGSAARPEQSRSYRPTPEERAMSSRTQLRSEDELTASLPPGNNNGVHIMRDSDDKLVVYKPAAEETFEGISWIRHVPGELAKREVAAYRINRLLGFDLVPPTGLIERGPHGRGSVQEYRTLRPDEEPWHAFDAKQQQQAAVLHYIIGMPDGLAHNYRRDENGDLVLFDHGYAFPQAPDPRRDDAISFGIDSDFADTHRGANFDPDVLEAVDSLSPDQVRGALDDLGFDESAINGVLARIEKIKSARTIPSSDLDPSMGGR